MRNVLNQNILDYHIDFILLYFDLLSFTWLRESGMNAEKERKMGRVGGLVEVMCEKIKEKALQDPKQT